MGHPPAKGEVEAIIRRIDLDGNELISTTEFSEALTLFDKPVKEIKSSPKKEPLYLEQDKI